VKQGDIGESRSEIGTRGTQVHVPSVEDRYILLAIKYMTIVIFSSEPPLAEGIVSV
jgi:hypothetical protein